MRMWMINPAYPCRRHLTGEHGEIHKFLNSFEKKYKINGRIHPVVQIEPAAMLARHDELSIEMERRGGNHRSPYTLPDLSYLPNDQRNAKADIRYNIVDLCKRCADCRKRILSRLKIVPEKGPELRISPKLR